MKGPIQPYEFAVRSSTYMQNGKNITIKCIAEKMNISPSTVSRALNGKSGVSKEVREQIVALSQEMNYQTNRIAQSLRTSKSMEIGVIIPDSSNPFFSAMLTGIDSYAREMGYTLLMINSCNSPEVERKAIETFCELHVAGLLSVPTCVKHYDHLPMPVIFLTRCDNSDSNFNYIITDDVPGRLYRNTKPHQQQPQRFFFPVRFHRYHIVCQQACGLPVRAGGKRDHA